jgi:cystathionine gamma-synthase
MRTTIHPETRAVHAGRHVDPATGAVATPIHLSTTYERDRDGQYSRGYAYSTFNNPNRQWLENAIAELDGGACAVAAASGMAAISSVLSVLAPGDRVLVSHDLFQGTARLLNDQVKRWGIEFDLADTTDLRSVEAAFKPKTRMVWVDTPSNPLMRLTDIERLAKLAHARDTKLVVDSTFATFALQRPLDLGADVVVYAATKYISGHTDVVNGLAVFRDSGELSERARAFQINVGATPSPFDCWLVHRGIRTLPLRMRAHSEGARQVAEFLNSHPEVECVYYPGLASSKDFALARRQMPQGCGGMLSFVVKGGRTAAVDVVARAQLFVRAASLGGVESLIEHRASSPIQTKGEGIGFQMPEDLLRLSIGLEHPEDLIHDLRQALEGS